MSINASGCLIQARGLQKHYRHGKVQVEALRGVDLDVPQGAFIVIIGPSGGVKLHCCILLVELTDPVPDKSR